MLTIILIIVAYVIAAVAIYEVIALNKEIKVQFADHEKRIDHLEESVAILQEEMDRHKTAIRDLERVTRGW